MPARWPGVVGPFLALLVLLAGCSDFPPREDTIPSPDKELHLYVSNQSFDDPSADIRVTVDDEELFDGTARVENQHNWMLREADLQPGAHVVKALERDTGTRASQSFELPEGQQRWVVVDFWNQDGEPARFSITVSEQQVYFD